MKLKALLRLAKGHLIEYIVLIVLVIFHRFSYSYIPLFTQYLVGALNKYLNNSEVISDVNFPKFLIDFFESANGILQVAIYIGLALVIYQFIRYALMYVESYMKGAIQEKISKKLRVDLYEHIQNLNYKYHNNVDTGDLIQRVTSDVETTTGFVVLQLMQLIGLAASLISGAFQMYFINTTIMWICIAMLPVYAISSLIYFLKIEKIFDKVEKDESSMMTVIQENVSGTKVVKAFANESFEIEKMEAKNAQYRDMNIKANKIVAIYWGLMDFITVSQVAAVTILCIIYARNGIMDAAKVSAAFMLLGILIWPIRGLGRMINEFTKAFVAIGRIQDIMTQPTEYVNDGVLEPLIEGNVSFRNVSFKFEDDTNYLLKDVSFDIKKGETVAFIGKTGSGKSTIINLLLRMYDYEGSITIDGVELRDIKKKHIRTSIGAVLQDPFLYSKTVFENIAITNKNATLEDVKEAAEIASLAKDIHTFQQGYETKVGEKGTTLSGGQKQRVAIARVLVSNKPILIFDDALSAVDNKTDLLIRRALAQKEYKSTNIIITHRITTAKEADKIIVLNNQTVEAIGKHDELANQDGLYKSLWGIQGKLENEFKELMKEDISHAA
ncbi:ABC transporter ATP-binding protein [Acholeplasma hippikon]|uniref:ABC-type multidrug/protein/lipid transport system ATPase component n=1 Tax=Acholeplasma hippikon TaxID=264636 RepID=A0A449BK82_9MOLU|nr:ABC transporter ATP-binding protein [Acholeplasma hippikon]VEU82858.1 ABC-type multidrug/protein/lipid transport system ATPase component [Acholeplasma hippikon]